MLVWTSNRVAGCSTTLTLLLHELQSAQWQVMIICLLKALSLERVPLLRPAFESRDGVARLNRTLGEHKFTIEEFYCVLELLCPPEEGDNQVADYAH
jgi:hypothetical protein